MDLQEAIKYLKSHEITVEQKDGIYSITNAQGVSMKCTENAIINYAMHLKNPPKIRSLVGEFLRLQGSRRN